MKKIEERFFFMYLALALVCFFLLSGLYRCHRETKKAVNFCFYAQNNHLKQECLNDYEGQVVLLFFWSVDCAICLQELVMLRNLWEIHHEKGFQILGIATKRNHAAEVEQISVKYSLPFPIVLDESGAIAAAYRGTRLTPTFFLLNQFRYLSWYKLGAVQKDILSGKINLLLSQRVLNETDSM